MSKDLLMQYAKGGDMSPHFYIVFEVKEGKVIIHSCEKLKNGTNDILFRLVLTDDGRDVPEDDIDEAVKEYINNRTIETIDVVPFEGIPPGTEFTLNIK